jgi:hypothetical protein
MENERVHEEHLEIGDAFGEVLLACQEAGGAAGVAFELIERSDGYLTVGDAARYFSTDTDFAFDLAAGRVLDIGAGAGRASVALHLDYHEQNRRAGRLAGQPRLRARHRRLVTPWWDYLFCTPEELEEVIASTAWTLAEVTPRPTPRGQWVATLGAGA